MRILKFKVIFDNAQDRFLFRKLNTSLFYIYLHFDITEGWYEDLIYTDGTNYVFAVPIDQKLKVASALQV